MKIFLKENVLGNKAKNIISLYNNNFKIPETIIIEKNKINNFNINLLKINKKYILRPSFNLEDGKNKSYAGFFSSIILNNKKEVECFFIKNKNNLNNLFGGKNHKLNSIIIQDFIQTDIYGVYFTRDPNNIFEKGFYEIGKNNNSITSGKNNYKISEKIKLTFFQKKELELIGHKLEKIFNHPQDIEFCIENGKIIILQTRSITTGNNTIYNFGEIIKFSGVYQTLDFDELGYKQDFFSYNILNKLFTIIFINSNIYFKKTFFPIYLFKNINNNKTFINNKVNNKSLNNFYKNYQKYLIFKIIFKIIKFFTFQELDKKVLISFFKNYKYSFLLNNKSNIDIKFNYNTNFITRLFLKLEKQKNLSFKYLEEYKKEFQNSKDINIKNNKYYNIKNIKYNSNYIIETKLILYKGLILNKNLKPDDSLKYNWIYKGKINGKITNLNNFKYKKNLTQILIIENLDFQLYDKLEYISGVIIKNGNYLSHNSIILREYKIPSIINYNKFDKLKIGEKITL